MHAITNTPASFGGKYAYTYFLIKDGGTLRCTQHQHFDKIEFSGGNLRGWGGNAGYGIFQVLRLFKVSGNTAFSDGGDIVDPDDPYDRHPDNHAIVINGVPTVEFNIADVTGDDGDDATFYRPIAINYYYKKALLTNKTCGEWEFGLRKTGAGTMRLASLNTPNAPTASGSGDNVWPLNGTISVEEGELKVDGDQHALNLIDVAAGAYLSGTGIVNNVTFAAGGGFKISASATDALQINGDCSFGSSGRVVIINPDSLAEEEVSVTIAQIDGEVSGVNNLNNWIVNFNGVDRPASLWKISVKNGALVAKYSRGTVIQLK